QPPSSSLTLILPEEPGVSPRSNSERPKRQMSSRAFASPVFDRPLFDAPVFFAGIRFSLPLRFSHALAARPSRARHQLSRKMRRGGGLEGIERMSPSVNPEVAVIGLGSMGFGMATSLRGAGFEVTGCDVAAETAARFAGEGGKSANTPAEAAKGAGIVISVVL